MAEPLGKLVTPTAFNPAGVLRALELDANDYLKVAVMNLVTPAGASFPATPASGDLFWRTDLSLLCFYDGTRWLTFHEYESPARLQSTAVASVIGIQQVRSGYALYFTRIECTIVVVAPNNGANFWTCTLRSGGILRAAFTTLLTFTTAADAAGVVVDKSSAPATNTPANYGEVDMSVAPTLAPGALSINGTFYYRLIVT